MNSNEVTRRAVLAALGATSLSAAMRPSWAWADAPAGPPVARIEPVRETLWGETIVDPYRWMENPKDPDWEPFMRGQASHARTVLDSIPGRKALKERIAGLSGDTTVTSAVQVPAAAACSTRSGPVAPITSCCSSARVSPARSVCSSTRRR